MRPTPSRLVRVIPRTTLIAENPSAKPIRPLPPPTRSDQKRPNLIELLKKRKQEAGADYPANIRIEPILTKQSWKGIPSDAREGLRAMLKER